jgi:hypothetical protein
MEDTHMRNRICIAAAALAAAATLPAVVAAATSAYTTPTLRISQAGAVTVITASSAVGDDATARAAIYAPTGVTATTTQAPGSTIGTVKAQVSALALGGALLPLTGNIVVAPPGSVPAATQAACTQGQAPTATWLLVLTAAGQTINLPAYVIPTAGAETALGPLKVVFCLAPPDLPTDKGGATFGAKFLSAELTLNSVFSALPSGAWVAFWTPWQAGNGQVNAAATVASPAAVAPGAVTATARRAGRNGVGAVVSGRVTQGGQPRANATVSIYGGVTSLRRLGSVRSKGNGSFSFRARAGTRFQARVVAAPGSSAAVCTALAAGLGGVPCVNPTVNGFTARSATVRKR